MISVLIPTLNDERDLGPCLSGLMRAAMEGLVREVVVADGGSLDATLDVAEDAGAEIVTARGDTGALLAAGAGRAKSPWLLTLRPQSQLLPGWEAKVKQHLESRPGQGAWFLPGEAGLLARLAGPRDGVGLLVTQRAYDATPGFSMGVAERKLARRLGKLVRLDLPILGARSDPGGRAVR